MPDLEKLFSEHLNSVDVHLDSVGASLEFCMGNTDEPSETTAIGKARAFLLQAQNQIAKARKELDDEFDIGETGGGQNG